MVMMMSKTNDTLKFGHAKLEDRALADSELGAVTGGTKARGSWLRLWGRQWAKRRTPRAAGDGASYDHGNRRTAGRRVGWSDRRPRCDC